MAERLVYVVFRYSIGIALGAAIASALIAAFLRPRLASSCWRVAALLAACGTVFALCVTAYAILAETQVSPSIATVAGAALIFAGLTAIFTPIAWLIAAAAWTAFRRTDAIPSGDGCDTHSKYVNWRRRGRPSCIPRHATGFGRRSLCTQIRTGSNRAGFRIARRVEQESDVHYGLRGQRRRTLRPER